MSNPFFLISIVLSALLTFFTTVVMVEVALKLLRIRQERARASIRMLPFLSLLLELTLHSFGKYNVLNPLSCASCVQKLILSTFFPDLQTYLAANRIPLIEYLALDHHKGLFTALSIGWVMVTVLMTLRWGIRSIWNRRRLRATLEASRSCESPVLNKALLKELRAAKAKVVVSPDVTVPLATYQGLISIPERLVDRLTRVELESIIAHELEHIKKGDPIQRFVMDGFSALFWWVPTKWYKRRIERNQEMACDQAISKYALDPVEFASALMKVNRSKCMENQVLLCQLTGKKNGLLSRLKVVLGVDAPPKENFFLSGLIGLIEGVVLVMCTVLL